MAEYFRVEIGTLRQYATILGEAQHQLAGLTTLMSGGDPEIGNGKLNDAANDFHESWKYGANRLGEAVAETTEAVRQVARAYAAADQAVAEAMSALSGAATGQEVRSR